MQLAIIVLQLVFLEAVLSIDNAAVLGAMVAHLPDDRPVPWPAPLRGLGQAVHGLLGNARTAALRVGLLGAYLGRGLMLILAHLVVENPWLRVVGAAYLLRLALDNLGAAEPGEADAHTHPVAGRPFWGLVVTIELADLAFSLDNVVAAVAISRELWVVLVGVGLGILFMRFAAGWFSYAVEREPVLKPAAYLLVLNIGVLLLVEELGGMVIPDAVRFGLAAAILLAALAYAHWPPLRVLRPVLVWLAQGCANINEVIDWALVPVQAGARLAGRGLAALAAAVAGR